MLISRAGALGNKAHLFHLMSTYLHCKDKPDILLGNELVWPTVRVCRSYLLRPGVGWIYPSLILAVHLASAGDLVIGRRGAWASICGI